MINFALLGAGFIGSVHANNLALHPAAKFTYVYDIDTQKATRIAEQYGATAAASAGQIMTDGSIDAVIIAAATASHGDYVQMVAKAGKAVLCEKPLAPDLGQARAALAAVQAAGIPAMTGFNRRFDPSHVAVHEGVLAGEIGKVEIIQITKRGVHLPPPVPVAVSGGLYRESAIHFFDLLRWISSLEPVEIYAAGACLVDPRVAEMGDIDTAVMVLRMANGAFCQIDSSRRAAYGYDERVEVFGSLGMLESRRQRQRSVSHYTGGKIIEDGLHPGWLERMRDTYAYELDAFIKALETGAPPTPSLTDGLKAQLIAEAAVESQRLGRPVPILTA